MFNFQNYCELNAIIISTLLLKKLRAKIILVSYLCVTNYHNFSDLKTHLLPHSLWGSEVPAYSLADPWFMVSVGCEPGRAAVTLETQMGKICLWGPYGEESSFPCGCELEVSGTK